MADDDTKQEERAEETQKEKTTSSEGEAKSGEDSRLEKPIKPSKPVSASLEKIVEQIEKLTSLELADLVHTLEDRFGVSATAPVGASLAPSTTALDSSQPKEEKTTFNVILSASGANKISAIKAVRELVPTLGLKEAKDLVESVPKLVLEGVGKEAAEAAKKKLTEAGATVELQ